MNKYVCRQAFCFIDFFSLPFYIENERAFRKEEKEGLHMSNKLRGLLDEKKPIIGTFFELGGANAVEALGQTGLDFIIIDNEHGPFETESSLECIRTCEHSGLASLCRVREISRPGIMKLLDQGADGLIVPFIDNIDQIRDLVRYGKYAPVGRRGFSGSRKDRWGFAEPANGNPLETQMEYWNKETFLIPQCETLGALEHIEEIAAEPGVDGIFVGPFDLSISMGMPGKFQDPVFLAALERILKACKDNGKFSIMFTTNADWIQGYYEMGFDMVAWSMDASVMINGFRTVVSGIK